MFVDLNKIKQTETETETLLSSAFRLEMNILFLKKTFKMKILNERFNKKRK